MNTPLVIAKLKGNEEKEFFTDEEYDRWAKGGAKHEVKRFKGLGSFKTPEFKKIMADRSKYLSVIEPIRDDDKLKLELAFSGAKADERKAWLGGISYFHNFE